VLVALPVHPSLGIELCIKQLQPNVVFNTTTEERLTPMCFEKIFGGRLWWYYEAPVATLGSSFFI
jgi:hypothetical protein